MICLAHNIRYLIATTFEDILHADEIFTNALNIYKHISGDNLFNISQCDNSIIILTKNDYVKENNWLELFNNRVYCENKMNKNLDMSTQNVYTQILKGIAKKGF
jgi:hypothetical protein